MSSVLSAFKNSDEWDIRIPGADLKEKNKKFPFALEIMGTGAYKLCRQRIHRIEESHAGTKSLSPLLHLLHTYQDAKATDVRDKIYGVHSFASPCCRDAIPIE